MNRLTAAHVVLILLALAIVAAWFTAAIAWWPL